MDSISSEAWQTLTQRVRYGLRGRAPAPIADDVTQDVMLALLNHLGAIDDEEHLRRWLATTARNRLVTEFRRQSTQRKREVATANEALSGGAAEASAGMSDEDVEALNSSVGAWLLDQIAHLPEPYAEALQSVDVLGQSQAEYADGHGLSRSGARTRVQRGRRLLRELLARSCDTERDARGNFVRCAPRGGCCSE